MSSKHATTEHNRYERVRARIVDIYSRARIYGSTHTRILEQLTEVYATKDYQKLSGAYKWGLSEVSRMSLDAIHRYQIEWILGTADGPIPQGRGNHDWNDGRLSELIQTKQLYGGHYWKGTDKLFGEWKSLA